MKCVKRCALLLMVIGCGEGAVAPGAVEEAERVMPTFLSLHTTVIARTCSPNPGVCHQTNNYPDLTTPGSLLAMIGMPCNLELPDPTQGWDACEPKADRFEVFAEGADPDDAEPIFWSPIAWKEKLGVGRWKLGLERPPASVLAGAPQIRGGDVLLYADGELGVTIESAAGSAEVIVSAPLGTEEVEGYALELDAIMAVVAAGDPNKNGVFGWEAPGVEHGSLIHPGSISRSYLFGRITGTVPGTRMPLANQPLSDSEYLALGCWIEGLGGNAKPEATDLIDYRGCELAKMPVSYEIEPR